VCKTRAKALFKIKSLKGQKKLAHIGYKEDREGILPLFKSLDGGKQANEKSIVLY